MNFKQLYEKAYAVVNPKVLTDYAEVGEVGAAIVTDKGNIYVGVSIDTACSMGFCAEHSAIAAMVTAGETRIDKVIAVGESGEILPPCGRCREIMSQINYNNIQAEIMVDEDEIIQLKELLPHDWKGKKK